MTRRLFLGALAVAAGCRSVRPGAVPVLRVLSYNVHHGEGTDGRLDLARIAAVIRAARPDLVALQEVDRGAQRTGGIDQPAEYIRLTGLHGWFGSAMPFQGGDYGQCLLSRWPLREPSVLRLPGTPAREPRIAVAATVEVPGIGRLRWAGVHLDATRSDEDRWEQVEALRQAFAPEEGPALLAGDFNDVPESRVLRRMLEGTGLWADTAGATAMPTVPAGAPRSRIDYILALPGGAWRTRESTVLTEAVASDHRPLLAVLEWQG